MRVLGLSLLAVSAAGLFVSVIFSSPTSKNRRSVSPEDDRSSRGFRIRGGGQADPLSLATALNQGTRIAGRSWRYHFETLTGTEF